MLRRTPQLLSALALGAALVGAILTGCTVSTSRMELDGGVDPIDVRVFPPDTSLPDAGRDAGRPSCMPGEIDCSGVCSRVAADALNCGSCGNACPAGVTCAVGRCDCVAPMLACDGLCLDPRSDVTHCGDCDTRCEAGEMCTDGECLLICDAPNVICSTTAVGGEVTRVCTDLQTDAMNCGRCGTVCGAGAVCTAGRCQCAPGHLLCSGRCVDVTSDPDNCGSCGSLCGMGGVCAGSRCTSCGTDRTDCSGRCVDTMTNAFHCGMCGRMCGVGEGCSGGLCECVPGRIDCGAGCTDPMTDVRSCGGCGTDCGPGGVCAGGLCSCAAGLTMCGASCRDTMTSTAHCGGCDMPCPPLTGGVCAGGVCGCPMGQTACGGACVDTQSSTTHCGMCGMACAAGEYCIMGACTDAPPTRYMQITPPAGTVPFIDACAVPGHTEILAMTDDGSARVPLPFAFRYWATDHPAGFNVNVCTNGWMSLDGGTLASLSGTVPATSTPNAVIAPHWGDNVTRGAICVATIGTAPNRQFVVHWPNARYFASTTAMVTFEVVLHEGSGLIDLAYDTMTGTVNRTMGIENHTGMMGINACPGGTGTCQPMTGQRVRFVPIP